MTKPTVGQNTWGQVLNDHLDSLDLGNPASAASVAATARYARKDSDPYNVKAYGALGDGTTDDTAAIQAAINAAQPTDVGPPDSSGGLVLVPASTTAYIVSQLTLRYGVTLELQPGAILQRAAGDAQTGPMVLLAKNHAALIGKGAIKCLNAAPSGIVRIERDGAAIEWCRVRDVHIQGRGSSGGGDVGLALAGDTACFQNVVEAPVVSHVDTMVLLTEQANANHLRDITGYNIYATGYDFDGTLENTVFGGSISSSANNITVIKMRNAAQGNIVAISAEPGGTAVPYNIASGCLDNFLGPGFLNCAGARVDNGTRTTVIDRRLTAIGDAFKVAGTQVWAPQRVRKAANEIVNNSTTYQDDDHLTLALSANAEYEFSVFLTYDATITADMKVKLTLPAGATAHWRVDGGATGATTTGSAVFSYLTEASGQSVGAAGVGTKTTAHLYGSIIVGGTAGNLGIQWAQVVQEATDLTVYGTSSRMELRRVA